MWMELRICKFEENGFDIEMLYPPSSLLFLWWFFIILISHLSFSLIMLCFLLEYLLTGYQNPRCVFPSLWRGESSLAFFFVQPSKLEAARWAMWITTLAYFCYHRKAEPGHSWPIIFPLDDGFFVWNSHSANDFKDNVISEGSNLSQGCQWLGASDSPSCKNNIIFKLWTLSSDNCGDGSFEIVSVADSEAFETHQSLWKEFLFFFLFRKNPSLHSLLVDLSVLFGWQVRFYSPKYSTHPHLQGMQVSPSLLHFCLFWLFLLSALNLLLKKTLISQFVNYMSSLYFVGVIYQDLDNAMTWHTKVARTMPR